MIQKLIATSIIICSFLTSLSLISTIYLPKTNASTTNLVTYAEDLSNTTNPERGFYRNYYGAPDAAELNSYKANKTTLYRPIYNIRPFINSPFSVAFLNQLNDDAAAFRLVGAKIMPAFQYSDGTQTPNDATTNVILSHLEQLRPYLNDNKDVVTLLPSGFVGDYGEFTVSDNNNISFVTNAPFISSGDPTLSDLNNGAGRFVVNQNTRDIVNKILDVLPKERAFTVRQPATKKQLVNTMAPILAEEAYDQTPKSRLGHQNDSLLGNPLEGATFIYSQEDNPVGRNIEESYYNQDANYVPYIAETEFFDNGVSGQCSSALQLIKNRHISTINETYNLNTLNIWKSQGCYNEIAKKLGYRFVLKSSELLPEVVQNNIFNLKVNLKNDGYASPYNERKLEIILRNKSTGINYPFDVTSQSDPRTWNSQNNNINLDLNFNASVPIGDYDILFNLPDPIASLKNKPDYSIQFSNQNLWEPVTGYNKLNQTLTVKPNVVTDAQYYVAKNGLDNNNGMINSPFLSIRHCMEIAAAGDTCNVNDGEYLEDNLYINNSGTSVNPITIRSVNKHGAIIKAGQYGEGISIRGSLNNFKSYITIDGFEIKNAEYSCISTVYASHIKFLNNKLHNCGGGGISTNQSDYITIDQNVIFENAFTSTYQESGISMYQNRNTDNLPGFHNTISRNLSYNNKNTVPNTQGELTDGNGIIIDDSRNEQNNNRDNIHTHYNGETLIENNIIFGNGGKGIHVFESDWVTVRNNTVANNSRNLTGTLAGDLSNVWSSGNKWFNNIVVTTPNNYNNSAITNTSYNQNNDNSNNLFKSNLLYITDAIKSSFVHFDSPDHAISNIDNFFGSNPKLQDVLNSNILPNNFTLLGGSEAINNGDSVNIPTLDYFGNNRASQKDIGAIKYQPFNSNSNITNTVSLLVPLYIYPDGTRNYTEWRDLASMATAHPQTKITAIISHFGTDIWNDAYAKLQFQNGIKILKTAGIKVLGYVPSTYSDRSLQDLQSQKSSVPSIDSYLSGQGLTGVDGIFIDEMCNGSSFGTCNANSFQYYQAVQSKILQTKSNAIIVGNPGSSIINNNYYNLADTIVNFENSQSAFDYQTYQQQASVQKSKNGIVLYNSPQNDKNLVDLLLSKVGMLYLTGDNLPNPWDTLPSNLNQYLSWFDSYNSGQTVSSSSSLSTLSKSSSNISSSQSSLVSSSSKSSSQSSNISLSSSLVSSQSTNILNNGIPTSVEDAGPNLGDSNMDGQLDKNQINVATLPNAVNNQYIVVEAKSNSPCQNLTNVSTQTNSKVDVNYQYPAGFVNFSSSCNSIINVKLYFYGLSQNQNYKLRKFDILSGLFVDVPNVVISSITIDNKFVQTFEYSIADQGVLDEDRKLGNITDPVGVAQAVSTNGGGSITITNQTNSSSSSTQFSSSQSSSSISSSSKSSLSPVVTQIKEQTGNKTENKPQNQKESLITVRSGGGNTIVILFLITLLVPICLLGFYVFKDLSADYKL